MKKPVLVLVVLAAVAAFPACGKKKVAPAPPPAPVTPEAPPPAPAPPPRVEAPVQVDEYTRLKAMSAEELDKLGLFGDVRFDYDKADIRESERAALSKNADLLKKYDFIAQVTLEGHCDERGTVEYNLALGEQRAKVAADYLGTLGVSAQRLSTVSYGKERPIESGHDEAAWAKNRRAHFKVSR